jgi:hypothetical protein
MNPRGFGRSWVCFSCIPEPNVEETHKIGERFGFGVDTQLAYYSKEVDSWGRHKRFSDLDVMEECSYEGTREDAIWASMPNEY